MIEIYKRFSLNLRTYVGLRYSVSQLSHLYPERKALKCLLKVFVMPIGFLETKKKHLSYLV